MVMIIIQFEPHFEVRTAPLIQCVKGGGRGGGSGTNGGSKWNTCGGTALDAKLARKRHPVMWKWPQSGSFGDKNALFGHK